ncbi:hypothetical protein BDF19DRAFT_498023 [Syncephalis fuscata]|nr:hypothetical protein BDF19DRAFT_498023 [Syncephalis fuscata]
MPFIENSDGLYLKRLNHLSNEWNMAVNSLGTISIYGFYMQATGNIQEQRDQLLGIQMQMVLLYIVLMVIAQPYAIAAWCCLIPSFFGFTSKNIFNTIMSKINYIHCIFTIETKVGCVDYHPKLFLWYWFSVSMPDNILLSALFSRIALKQYRMFGSDMWKRLARDGLQIMSMTVLCNTICYAFIAFRIGGDNAELLFVVDWMIIATLLAKRCERMRKIRDESNRPKTEYMIGVSQITTAVSLTELDSLKYNI